MSLIEKLTESVSETKPGPLGCLNIFATPVFVKELDTDIKPLLKLALKLRKEDPTGVSKSNTGGWQSRDFIVSEFPKVFDPIVPELHAYFEQIKKEYGLHDFAQIKMGNCWFNINNAADSNDIHTHPNSFISGTIYLQAEEKHGKFVAYKPFIERDMLINQLGHYKAETTNANCSAFEIGPKTGYIMLFPSTMIHGVNKGEESKVQRISFAFNTVLE